MFRKFQARHLPTLSHTMQTTDGSAGLISFLAVMYVSMLCPIVTCFSELL